MLLRRRFGHQQEDQQAHRLVVGRVEADRLAQLEHRGHRRLQALDAAVRDGHAVAEAGRAEALAREQVVGDQGARRGRAGSRTAGRLPRTRASCWWRRRSTRTWAGGRMDGEAVHDWQGRDYAPGPRANEATTAGRRSGPQGPAEAALADSAPRAHITRLGAAWWWSCSAVLVAARPGGRACRPVRRGRRRGPRASSRRTCRCP